MKNNEDKILKEIEEGYDLISEKFSSTRNFFWKDLTFVADFVESGNRVLDFGCGNGRLIEILKNKNIEYFGVDISDELIKIAKEKYPEHNFLKIEAQKSLAFKRDFFNVIFAIAVFHHFPPTYQKKKIKELFDLLKPGGVVIATVWNLQDKHKKKEIEIPFRDNEGNVFKRYHWVFSEKDLQKLFKEVGFQIKKCDIIDNKNILIIAKK